MVSNTALKSELRRNDREVKLFVGEMYQFLESQKLDLPEKGKEKTRKNMKSFQEEQEEYKFRMSKPGNSKIRPGKKESDNGYPPNFLEIMSDR